MQLSDIQSKEPMKPILTQLPDLKVVHFYDPDSGDEIMTREDLVVVVTCEKQHSTLVQHADGTYIYSEVGEYFPPNPIEVVVPPEHIYDWPTSCPKDKESIVEGEDLLESQNTFKVDTTKNPSIVEDKCNIKKSIQDNGISETNGVHLKAKIVKMVDNSKKTNGGSYEKKQPLRGLLGELPNKIGVKLSDFAEAQKKHSQTWAPEGYGEVPREIPDWIWPPQPLGCHRERYNTPPSEALPLPIEPLEPKEPHFSITWHVRKDGFAKVHGKVKQHTNF